MQITRDPSLLRLTDDLGVPLEHSIEPTTQWEVFETEHDQHNGCKD